MFKALKGVLIFATMIALPIVLDNLVSRRPGVPITAPAAAWIFGVLIIAMAGVATVFFFRIDAVSDDIRKITGWLQLAERDFNNIINSGYNQTSRLGRATERAEWIRVVPEPATQVFDAGYRSLGHELFDANQTDLKNRGKTMGKATLTAFLLRELYEGRVKEAQAKVISEVKNSDDPPYIAPGIRELIGYDAFTADGGFPKDAGADSYYLKAAADIGGFPNAVAIVRADGTVAERWDAIRELTQQARPGRPAGPNPPEPQSAFWRIVRAMVDKALDR